jgi:hypothetical protein
VSAVASKVLRYISYRLKSISLIRFEGDDWDEISEDSFRFQDEPWTISPDSVKTPGIQRMSATFCLLPQKSWVLHSIPQMPARSLKSGDWLCEIWGTWFTSSFRRSHLKFQVNSHQVALLSALDRWTEHFHRMIGVIVTSSLIGLLEDIRHGEGSPITGVKSSDWFVHPSSGNFLKSGQTMSYFLNGWWVEKSILHSPNVTRWVLPA